MVPLNRALATAYRLSVHISETVRNRVKVTTDHSNELNMTLCAVANPTPTRSQGLGL